MAEVTINIEDYITPADIKAIAMDELRRIIHRQFSQNEREIDRLISNLGHEFIFNAVSESIGENAEDKIGSIVKKLLEDEATIKYEMWRRKDAWTRTESPAIGIMEEAIKDNKELIYERVKDMIKGYEFRDVATAIYEALDQIVYDKVFNREK